MIKNYLKIAFRNLWRHRVFSLINILGLTVGMTACFLIFMYVRFELSYDTFHTKADRIYRVVADIKTPTETMKNSGPSWAVAPHITELPEVEVAVRVLSDNILFRKDDIKFNESNALWADSAFFTLFDFKLLKGDPRKVLSEPFSIVLSETSAKKYFGSADPIGQTILITGEEGRPGKVTGVMRDIPENSQIRGDVIVSMTTITKRFAEGIDNQWGNYGPFTYLLLKSNVSAATFQAKLPAFLEKWNGKEMKAHQMFPTLSLEPMKKVYLYSDRDGQARGSASNVYLFSIIAVFIIVIACINFVNLTTARSSERAKEVGIRKVSGALRSQLARQFIGESLLISSIAFFLTLAFAALLLSPFNQLAGKIISPGIFSNVNYLLLLLATALVIGLLAGIYPALLLSSFKPVVVLKGRFATGSKGNLLRKALVITQFTISTALIIATIVVYTQMQYMRNQELGFKKDHVLVIDTNNDQGRDALKQAVSGMRNVKAVALSGSVPGSGNQSAYSEIENINGGLQVANLDLYFVDFDYIPLYGIKLAAGRAFDGNYKTDTTQAMILNEAAVKMFGYLRAEDAIGKRFKQWGREGTIIGVIKDFHFRSLQQPIKPLSMRIEPDRMQYLSVNLSSADLPVTLAAIEKQYKKVIPNRPYSFYFMDEFFNRQYESEEQFGKLFLNFSVLAIFISCMGLLGLALYSTVQRTKEIGIRKVLGASVSNVSVLLSKEFIKLVLIAMVIASPVAYYFMHQWLLDFAYRVPISWWMFAVAGSVALLIALITVSFQAIKAAVANPVKSLRTE